MKRLGAVLFLVLVLALAGCGGGGGNVFNQFEGTWSGPFQAYNPGGGVESSGNLTLQIDSFGGARVTMVRTDSNPQTQVINSGTLDNNRVLRWVWRWNNTNDRESRGEIARTGNLLKPAANNGRITVNYAGGQSGEMEFTLTRQ